MPSPREHERREQQRLAAMARQGKTLAKPLSEEREAEVRAEAEKRLGLRCTGCGGRITVGLKFTRIDIAASGPDGKPVVDVATLAACNGADGCDFASEAKKGADVIEMIEFAWLTGDDPVGAGQGLDAQVAAAEAMVRGEASEEPSARERTAAAARAAQSGG